VQQGFKTVAATIDVSGRTEVDHEVTLNPSALARSADGTLAYVAESVTHAPELYVRTAGGHSTAVTTFNTQWTSISVTAPEFVTYPSAGGVQIEAALLTPAGAAKPLPLVVLVHGGPTGRWSDTFEPWGQLLAARGYAVLYPNVRGSTGYGQKFVELNRAD